MLVIGLAETGVAVARVLRAEGCDVTVVEDAPADTARYGERVAEVRALGAELVEAPDDARIASSWPRPTSSCRARWCGPAIRAIVAAEARGVPVRSEIDLAAERAPRPDRRGHRHEREDDGDDDDRGDARRVGRARDRGGQHRPPADRRGRGPR